jgi:hypothetical protein
VSRQVGPCHTICALLARIPKMASLYFRQPSQDSCHVAMVEAPVSYLESTVPAAACEIAVSIRTASCACFAFRALSLRPLSTSCTISARLPPLWQEKKKATADELDAHATANGYQRGAHREEHSRRDGNKHEDKTRKDQDATLDPYVM